MTLRIDINTSGVVKAEKVIDRSFDDINKNLLILDKNIQKLESAFSSSMKKNTNEVEKFSRNTQKELKKTNTAFSGFIKTVKAAALGYATVLATMEISEFVSNTLAAGVALDSLERSFLAITGSSSEAAMELQFVNKISKDLGLSLPTLEKSYKDILAASKNTKLEGQGVRDVFLAISKASAVLGMSADDTQGSLRALSQMISKGNVQAEELRGQLGERLPGAFQMAAEAMGVTTMKLNDMLENGEVLAEDLLPNLARVLESRFGKAAEDAGDRAQAAFEGFNNAVLELQRLAGERGLTDFLANIAKSATAVVDMLNEIVKPDTLEEKLRKINDEIKNLNREAAIPSESAIQASSAMQEYIRNTRAAIELSGQFNRSQRILVGRGAQIAKGSVVNPPTQESFLIQKQESIIEKIAVRNEINTFDRLLKRYRDVKKEIGKEEGPNLFDNFLIFPEMDYEKSEKAFFDKIEKDAEKAAKALKKVADRSKEIQEILSKPAPGIKTEEEAFDEYIKKVNSVEDALDSFFSSIEEKELDPDILKDGFDRYVDTLNESIKATTLLENATIASFQAMEDSLTNFILTGELGFEELARTAIAEITRIFVKSQIIAPIANYASGANILGSLSNFFMANGGIASGSNISQFSNSIVSSPTVLPNTSVSKFATGTAMIGEAGPEAVMPLTRIGGKLGVRSENSAPIINLNINNTQSDKVQVDTTKPMMNDRGEMVLGIVINAIDTNQGGFRDRVRSLANQR